MKIKEILDRTEIGGIVNDKTVLAALKRKGLIFDYSPWGYLESKRLRYKEIWDGRESSGYLMVELFPEGNAKTIPDRFESRDAAYDALGTTGEISAYGCKFRTKYLDGCFQPYLCLTEKNGDRKEKVHPRMSVFGAIV